MTGPATLCHAIIETLASCCDHIETFFSRASLRQNVGSSRLAEPRILKQHYPEVKIY
jgi:hypothetical protein